ncbi:hypothetical protein GCM10010517_16600 [Streptosporangium fragile]|uniref:Uncharacterized protein n=1 Tax=Streptosporangium fragile TaxID=46186 RepID=A0ABP6I9B1_9ACTN
MGVPEVEGAEGTWRSGPLSYAAGAATGFEPAASPLTAEVALPCAPGTRVEPCSSRDRNDRGPPGRSGGGPAEKGRQESNLK